MGTRISRRELLAFAAPALGGIGLLSALHGCGVPTGEELDRRMTAALRSAVAGAAGSGRIARAANMSESQALQLLRGDLSDRVVHAITSNRHLTRRFIDERRTRDLSEGRSRYVDGWLLAEVEVAVAVVLGF